MPGTNPGFLKSEENVKLQTSESLGWYQAKACLQLKLCVLFWRKPGSTECKDVIEDIVYHLMPMPVLMTSLVKKVMLHLVFIMLT